MGNYFNIYYRRVVIHTNTKYFIYLYMEYISEERCVVDRILHEDVDYCDVVCGVVENRRLCRVVCAAMLVALGSRYRRQRDIARGLRMLVSRCVHVCDYREVVGYVCSVVDYVWGVMDGCEMMGICDRDDVGDFINYMKKNNISMYDVLYNKIYITPPCICSDNRMSAYQLVLLHGCADIYNYIVCDVEYIRYVMHAGDGVMDMDEVYAALGGSMCVLSKMCEYGYSFTHALNTNTAAQCDDVVCFLLERVMREGRICWMHYCMLVGAFNYSVVDRYSVCVDESTTTSSTNASITSSLLQMHMVYSVIGDSMRDDVRVGIEHALCGGDDVFVFEVVRMCGIDVNSVLVYDYVDDRIDDDIVLQLPCIEKRDGKYCLGISVVDLCMEYGRVDILSSMGVSVSDAKWRCLLWRSVCEDSFMCVINNNISIIDMSIAPELRACACAGYSDRVKMMLKYIGYRYGEKCMEEMLCSVYDVYKRRGGMNEYCDVYLYCCVNE